MHINAVAEKKIPGSIGLVSSSDMSKTGSGGHMSCFFKEDYFSVNLCAAILVFRRQVF